MHNYSLQFSRDGQEHTLELHEQSKKTQDSVLVDGHHYSISGDKKEWLLTIISQQPKLTFKSLQQRLANAGALTISMKKIDNITTPLLSKSNDTIVTKEAKPLDTFIEKLVKTDYFRGCVSVIKDGKCLLRKGYGVANPNGELNTPNTRFALASIGKGLTAAAIMLLVQDGKLSLDDPINNHLPKKFQNNKWKKIKIKNLLNHSSGIHNYGPEKDDETKEKPFTFDEILPDFKEGPPWFEPGTMFSYSNANYAILGAIIEHVSEQKCEDFFQERIFAPIGMKSTGMADSYDEKTTAIGFFHEKKDGELQQPVNMKVHISKASTAGGFVTTVKDMEKWHKALYDDSFLSQDSRNQMFSPNKVVAFEIEKKDNIYDYDEKTKKYSPKKDSTYITHAHYGFGFFSHDSKPNIFFHEGGICGFSNIFIHNKDPKNDYGVTILSNYSGSHDPDLPPEEQINPKPKIAKMTDDLFLNKE